MMGLDADREYFVLATTDENGKTVGHPYFTKDKLGKILWVFSSHEKANKCFAEPNDETRDVLREQERIAESNAEALGWGRGFRRSTVQYILALLEQNDIDHIILDPGMPGSYNRVYPSPHKA
jgi:hypothetical protein